MQSMFKSVKFFNSDRFYRNQLMEPNTLFFHYSSLSRKVTRQFDSSNDIDIDTNDSDPTKLPLYTARATIHTACSPVAASCPTRRVLFASLATILPLEIGLYIWLLFWAEAQRLPCSLLWRPFWWCYLYIRIRRHWEHIISLHHTTGT